MSAVCQSENRMCCSVGKLTLYLELAYFKEMCREMFELIAEGLRVEAKETEILSIAGRIPNFF